MKPAEAKKLLRLDKAEIKQAKALREKSILDAISLTKGAAQDARIPHDLWRSGAFEVGVAKPGKEADPKRKNPNVNDMWPYIKKDGEVIPESATFKDISRELEHNLNRSPHALELLGSLFVRSALMLDHVVEEGAVKYAPPAKVVAEVKSDIPTMYKVPLDVFLQYVEAIALNEDVKYFTKGYPIGVAAGRRNNLLSCAHFIAVLLRRAELTDLAYGFSMMRGVSPLSLKKAKECFPLLGDDVTAEK